MRETTPRRRPGLISLFFQRDRALWWALVPLGLALILFALGAATPTLSTPARSPSTG